MNEDYSIYARDYPRNNADNYVVSITDAVGKPFGKSVSLSDVWLAGKRAKNLAESLPTGYTVNVTRTVVNVVSTFTAK